MLAFKHQGFKVISLTQQEGYLINDFLSSHGVEAYSKVVPGPRAGWLYYLKHVIFFIRFCWKHNVHIVYSHLEPANFVAVLGQYFVKASIYINRHHIDEGSLYNFDKSLSYKVTYHLAKKIIVVSNHAKQYMVRKERLSEHKILNINLAYDFSLYASTDSTVIGKIREDYSCEVLLVSALRLTKFKRPDVSIETLQLLLNFGLNAKLVLLGKGEMLEPLKVMIADRGLLNKAFLIDFVSNPLDYMSAADFFIHPSILESSCVVVKEAGLVSKPAIVCSGIGDFNDYIQHGKNGFLVDQHNFAMEAAAIIMHYKDKQELLNEIGSKLSVDVHRLFDINNVVQEYDKLNKILS
jgi:glycosyltransferase involved in cell wall biosynthesis